MEQIKLHAGSGAWNPAHDEAQRERKLRTWALPLALILARLLVSFDAGRFLNRIFAAMWIHELGHAVAAWMCGYLAFPGPWLTPMSSEPSSVFAVGVAVVLGVLAFRAWEQERPRAASIYIIVLCLHLLCWLLLPANAAKTLIIFSGDGGSLVLGTLLMCTLYAKAGSALHAGWLRWGFLAIGAGAFMDAFEQWWAARSDADRIPFGMNEGAGLSDPSVLSDIYGWSAKTIVDRYVLLGCLCLAALALVYVVQLRRSRAAAANAT